MKWKRMAKKTMAFLIGMAVSLGTVCSDTPIGRLLGGMIEASAMTQSEFDGKLAEIQNQYKTGASYSNPWPTGGYDCYGYAHWVANTVTGSNSYEERGWNKIYDLTQVQVGDIVQYGNQACNAAEQKVSFGHFGV